MAIKTITHYFDYKSPYAYLAQEDRADAVKPHAQPHFEQVRGGECPGEALAGQARRAGLWAPEIERAVAPHGKVLRAVAGAEPTLLCPQGDG